MIVIKNRLGAALENTFKYVLDDVDDILTSFTQDVEDALDAHLPDNEQTNEAVEVLRNVLIEWTEGKAR